MYHKEQQLHAKLQQQVLNCRFQPLQSLTLLKNEKEF